MKDSWTSIKFVDRRISVAIRGFSSDFQPINVGVPKGTSTRHSYAGDCTPHSIFQPRRPTSTPELDNMCKSVRLSLAESSFHFRLGNP